MESVFQEWLQGLQSVPAFERYRAMLFEAMSLLAYFSDEEKDNETLYSAFHFASELVDCIGWPSHQFHDEQEKLREVAPLAVRCGPWVVESYSDLVPLLLSHKLAELNPGEREVEPSADYDLAELRINVKKEFQRAHVRAPQPEGLEVDVVSLLQKTGQKMTGPKIFEALEKAGKVISEHDRSHLLPGMKAKGLIDNSRKSKPPGYYLV